MEEIFKMTDLRLKTRDIIDRIINNHLAGIIVSRSEPLVVIQPVETYRSLQKELQQLRRKVFELECSNARQEIEDRNLSGPFKTGEDLLKNIKNND